MLPSLAHFAEAVRPKIRLIAAASSESAGLTSRCRQIIEMTVREKNRLRRSIGAIATRFALTLEWLENAFRDGMRISQKTFGIVTLGATRTTCFKASRASVLRSQSHY